MCVAQHPACAVAEADVAQTACIEGEIGVKAKKTAVMIGDDDGALDAERMEIRAKHGAGGAGLTVYTPAGDLQQRAGCLPKTGVCRGYIRRVAADDLGIVDGSLDYAYTVLLDILNQMLRLNRKLFHDCTPFPEEFVILHYMTRGEKCARPTCILRPNPIE